MSETLKQFVVRRRGELDEEASKLQAQLRAVEAEREKVDRVAAMYAAEPEPERVPSADGSAFAQWIAKRPVDRSMKRVSEATIKEMVIDLLEKEWGSMTALDILAKINERAGIDYPRTSLSPQLSRLKAEGKIHREGRLWALGGGPDVGQVETVDEDPRTDYKTDEAPTGAEAS